MNNEVLMARVISDLVDHEGIVDQPYVDTTGNTTIGIGHNLSATGLCYEAMIAQLIHDLRMTEEYLEAEFGAVAYANLPDRIKRVLLNMMFNLGPRRFHGFIEMRRCVMRRDWKGMRKEMLDSLWSTQIHEDRLIDLMALVDAQIKSSEENERMA